MNSTICFYKRSVFILKEIWRGEDSKDAVVTANITPISIHHNLTQVTNKNPCFPIFAFQNLCDYAILCVCGSDQALCFSPLEESLPGENLPSRLFMLWITLGSMAANPLTNYIIGNARSCLFFSTGNKKYLL